ncbi:TfuA-related McrA-glycine thioamidation protein [Methanoplanus endosymbiosus]|uniref:TfuA-related McrA-glycine thioamidation protein n=1 Tax=Methanoplanus endosymbiosus TaxID=33865 RepID=A0A9E7TKP0_9EURY|nr:TfuA-related McrA-glycine thioamidation protein [Methanoplanus endosymbiosus]UUX91411.1 TfuA-related McrA-glycine thioamidation protein [Methanoplanus endosymbiosus]
MKPDAVVFLGPSLPLSEAEQILPGPSAEYRPPVKRGDLEAVMAEKPKIVCIIDGLFFQDCSVGHREVLKLLNSGIKVYGASSMGALRACELEDFGMTGIGRVFEMYRDGVVESDDEVALACDPFTGESISDALIDIRINLERAVDEGVITPDESTIILKTASDIYYPERTYRKIIKAASESIGEASAGNFMEFIGKVPYSQKREDAKALLSLIAGKMRE